MTSDTYIENLKAKLLSLNETAWENRLNNRLIEEWLDNFTGETGDVDKERMHAAYLLSQFMYFGSQQMRELICSLYRDFFKYPIVESIRRGNNNTTDVTFIEVEYLQELQLTRFFGVGNPSESGSHLLYFFRQENRLPTELFLNTGQVFNRAGAQVELKHPNVKRYVFIDDICGTGTQAKQYSDELVKDIKELNPDAEVIYLVLFGCSEGLTTVKNGLFTRVDAVIELDKTFKVFDQSSRHFEACDQLIDRNFALHMSAHYGVKLCPGSPLGYKNSQLLLGFHHNTPDNSLPIMWFDEMPQSWLPVFRRYPKYYGGII